MHLDAVRGLNAADAVDVVASVVDAVVGVGDVAVSAAGAVIGVGDVAAVVAEALGVR